MPLVDAAAVVADNCNIMQSLLANQRQHFTRLLERANDSSVGPRGAPETNAAGAAAAAVPLAALQYSAATPLAARVAAAASAAVTTAPARSSPATASPGAGAAVPCAAASPSFAFKCPLCSLVYRTQTFLNEHMRNEHSILI